MESMAMESANQSLAPLSSDVEEYSQPRVPTEAERVVLYITLSCFSVLGVIGNAIAFYIFFRRRNSGTSNIFILALAGIDFVSCLVTIPFTIVFEALWYRLYYDGLCKLYFFFITSTIPYSSFIMTAIAVDRYFCICHPFLHVLNVHRARLVVIGLAVPAFFFGIITGMFYGVYSLFDHLIVNGTVFYRSNVTVDYSDGYLYVNASQIDLSGDNVIQRTVEMDGQDHQLYVYRQIVAQRDQVCHTNYFYLSQDFFTWFHKVYTFCYPVCFVIVAVLYILIYYSICTRRARKTKRRKKNYYSSVANHDTKTLHAPQPPVEVDTALTECSNNGALLGKTGNAVSDSASQTVIEMTRIKVSTSPVAIRSPTHLDPTTATTTNTITESPPTTTTTTTTVTTTSTNTNSPTATATTVAPTTTDTTTATAPSNTNPAANTSSQASTANHEQGKNGTKGTDGANPSACEAAGESTRVPKRRGSTSRDRNLYANIKTAMMLFVVTLVFFVAFAPACFVIHNLLTMQLNVFYMYFIYNVANPFIYAFMNQAFRQDLKKLLKRR